MDEAFRDGSNHPSRDVVEKPMVAFMALEVRITSLMHHELKQMSV